MKPHVSTPDLDRTDPHAARPPEEQGPIVVRGSEDLVAAVPHLVGFAPERSVVVVAMRRSGQRLRLGLVARFDLPPAGRRPAGREGPSAAVGALVGQVVDVMSNDSPEQVVVLVYDSAPCAVVAPWQRLVERLEKAFRTVGIAVLDALYISGGRFRSYRCTDPGCCPASGRPVDPTSSGVAAEFVARGSSPLANRAALQALVQPMEQARCADVEAAAAAAMSTVGPWWGDESSPQWRAWQTDSLQLLQQVAERYLAGEPRIREDEAGRVVAGLCDIPVRDAAALLLTSWASGWRSEDDGPGAGAEVAWCQGTRMGELLQGLSATSDGRSGRPLAGAERDRVLEQLWRDVATRCDGPLAVPALTLLGMHAWSQGNGALALVAAERALSIDPGYRLAQLLDQTLCLGVRPRRQGSAAGD
jgi:hypothetical protein